MRRLITFLYAVVCRTSRSASAQ